METTQIIESLRRFILNELIRDPSVILDADTSIIESGLIGSFSIMEIALFIESEYGLFIPDGDLTVMNMNTLDSIARMVASRL